MSVAVFDRELAKRCNAKDQRSRGIGRTDDYVFVQRAARLRFDRTKVCEPLLLGLGRASRRTLRHDVEAVDLHRQIRRAVLRLFDRLVTYAFNLVTPAREFRRV